MILLADDDEEDRELTRDALQDSKLANEMRCVVDGQDLMDYLRHEGRYSDPSVEAPRPGIILLDLNMPKKDGREALAEIKADERRYRQSRPAHERLDAVEEMIKTAYALKGWKIEPDEPRLQRPFVRLPVAWR